MRLRTQYVLFIVLIHLVTLVLSFYILQDNKILFIASEFVILLSLFFAIRLYQSLVKPLKLLLQGVEAINDRDFNVKFMETGRYEMDELIKVYNKMIDELRNERRMQQEQHYFLEKLIESSPTGIIILDFDGKIAQINPVARQLFGLKNLKVNTKLTELAHPLAAHLPKLKADKPLTIKLNGIRTFKCSKAHFLDRGFPRYFIMIEELTAEILETEKKAYEKVIRMMAHEVNNSVGPINSILDSTLFFKDQIQNSQRLDFVKALSVAKQRNLKLNRFMRNFADVVRLPLAERKVEDLKNSLQQMVTLFLAEAKQSQISIELIIPEQPFYLSFDAQQIEQALVNIIKNAMESIGANGQIKILLDEKARTLIIADNGPGIKPELADQLFQPFFSSKQQGQGIGLTLTREILFNHQFTFSLQTEADGWTRFRIQL